MNPSSVREHSMSNCLTNAQRALHSKVHYYIYTPPGTRQEPVEHLVIYSSLLLGGIINGPTDGWTDGCHQVHYNKFRNVLLTCVLFFVAGLY